MQNPKFVLITLLVFVLGFINFANAQWVVDKSEIYRFNVISSAESTDYYYVGTASNGLWRTSNNGTNWTQCQFGLESNNLKILSIAIKDNFVYAGGKSILLMSNDNGNNWKYKNFFKSDFLSLAIKDNILYAGINGAGKGLQYTTDNGLNFTPILSNQTVSNLIFIGDSLFYSNGNGVNYMKLADRIPIRILETLNVTALTIFDNYIYVGTDHFGLFKSTNLGGKWTQDNIDPLKKTIYCFYHNDNFIYEGTKLKGVCVLNKNGESLGPKYENKIGEVWSLWVINNLLYAGTTYKVYTRNISICPYCD